MSGISDATMGSIEYALGGLAMRSDVRANNVANSNTPGFQASTVSFESALGEAMAEGGDYEDLAEPVVTAAGGDPDALGNNVSLEDEMVGGMKDNLSYSTLINTYNFKLDVLRKAIS